MGDLETNLAGVKLRNPVILAAGTAGVVDEGAGVLGLGHVGAVVTKSITLEPREGNPTWRVAELPVGMLNAIGLANPGVERFVAEFAPRAGGVGCVVIGSIAGRRVEEYAAVAAHFAEFASTIPAIEVNVSCPNVHGGTEFAADVVALREVVRAVREVAPAQRLFVKLSPVPLGTPRSMSDLARGAIEAGADGLTLSNTMHAMAIDPRTRRPRLANVTGGLSGAAIHPVVVKLVYDVYRNVAREAGVPIIGAGGVSSWESAAEFVLAGASAVQVGTASLASPSVPRRVVRGLEKWIAQQGFASVADAVGRVRTGEDEEGEG